MIIFVFHLAKPFCRLDSVHNRHHMIHKDNMILLFLRHLQRPLAALHRINLHMKGLQQSGGHFQIDLIVIHHQNQCLRCGKVHILFCHGTHIQSLMIDSLAEILTVQRFIHRSDSCLITFFQQRIAHHTYLPHLCAILLYFFCQ